MTAVRRLMPLRGLGWLLLTAAICLLLTGGLLSRARSSPSAAQWLAYLESERGAPAILHIRPPQGQPHFRRKLAPQRVYWMEWSPDARQLVMTAGDGEAVGLYVWKLSEAQPRRLSLPEGTPLTPRWSPDGRWIAVVVWRGLHSSEIYRVRARDGHVEALTATVEIERAPAWSPDGRLVFGTMAGTGNSAERLHMMNADGTDRRALESIDYSDIAARWSPDGAHIAYFASTGADFGLCVRAAGGAERWCQFPVNGGDAAQQVWSPDGQWLVYIGGFPAMGVRFPSQIVRQSITGSPPQPLRGLPDVPARLVAVSSDGKWLAWVGGDPLVTNGLYLTAIAGGETRVLQATGAALVAPQWSPLIDADWQGGWLVGGGALGVGLGVVGMLHRARKGYRAAKWGV